ncbi:GatB/YqeY domain-containing protein [Candidatus Microgenomates bacterium]|nr:GatB/YqeY domain-containing protein [Candidatus Microgenomates bacterium]
MNLRNQIQQDINSALKKKEKQKLSILRFLNAQIQNKEIEKGRKKLADEEIIKLMRKQVKELKESLSFFEKGKREDLIKKTKTEIEILKTYLPQQLSDEQLEKEVEKIIKQNPSVSHQGALIGICIKTLVGKADNQRIAHIIAKKFKP